MHLESKFDIFGHLLFGAAAIYPTYRIHRWFFERMFSKRKGAAFYPDDLIYLKNENEFVVVKRVNRALRQVTIQYVTFATKTCSYVYLLNNSSNFSKMKRNYASIPLNFKTTFKTFPSINENILRDLVSSKSNPYLTQKKPISIQLPSKKKEELQIMVPIYTKDTSQILETIQTLKNSISSYIEELAVNQRSKMN